MKQTIFFDRYCICTAANGTPDEVSRSGAAINYKAIDTQSGENVELQLIPLAVIDEAKRKQFEERARVVQKLNHINIAHVFAVGIESGYLGLVSESLRGETADAWLVARGRLSPEAVVRIGIQVLRALAAGAFYGLSHRAIQPSNIMILHAEAPDGGWPLIKLLNFGVAASELYKESSSEDFLTALGSQFASPEQLLNGALDFRSEIYSLGATMSFLLTGNMPLPRNWAAIYGGMRTAPELRSLPRPVARLLRRLLHEDPAKRPQDPVALEGEMKNCLARIERHVKFGRSFLMPASSLAQADVVRWRSPRSAALRGAFAGATLVTVAALSSAFLLPRVAAMWHHDTATKQIGGVVGVRQPEPAKAPPAVAAESATATPTTSVAPTLAPSIPQKPDLADESRHSEQFGLTENSRTESKSEEYSRRRQAKTVSSDSSSSSSEPVTMEKASRSKRADVSSAEQNESAGPVARALPVENEEAGVDASSNGHPRFIGLSPDGRAMLRLPSGEIVTFSRRSG
ncbi:MAG: serine/threonine protein kinase, partial [Chthoniobacterales bacterium]